MRATGLHRPTGELPTLAADTPQGVMTPMADQIQTLATFRPETRPEDRNRSETHLEVRPQDRRQTYPLHRATDGAEDLQVVARTRRYEVHRH